jgi:hypothetical protein
VVLLVATATIKTPRSRPIMAADTDFFLDSLLLRTTSEGWAGV